MRRIRLERNPVAARHRGHTRRHVRADTNLADDGPRILPRLGPDYLLYVSSKGSGDVIWKLADGATTELWSAPDHKMIGGPGIAPTDAGSPSRPTSTGRHCCTLIDADGTNARVVNDSLGLRGTPAWTPDGRSITSAADVDGTPHLFNISSGRSGDSSRAGLRHRSRVVSGRRLCRLFGRGHRHDVPVKAVTANGTSYPIPNLTLTRGARRLRFLRGQPMLVVMRGGIQHRDLWQIDLASGTERQVTSLPPTSTSGTSTYRRMDAKSSSSRCRSSRTSC